MSRPAPKPRRARPELCRRDGWTADRQLRFLEVLARTRNVGAAAAAAGMSREGAYRLRNRQPEGLFAALWDMTMAPAPAPEVHNRPITDGWIMRVVGNHFRRKFAGPSADGR